MRSLSHSQRVGRLSESVDTSRRLEERDRHSRASLEKGETHSPVSHPAPDALREVGHQGVRGGRERHGPSEATQLARDFDADGAPADDEDLGGRCERAARLPVGGTRGLRRHFNSSGSWR